MARRAASEPVPGSVSAKQPSASPEQSRGSHARFCSSVPYAAIVLATRPSETETMPRTAESPRPSSSSDQAVGEVVAAGAAVLLGDGQPEEAQLAELLHDAAVDLLRAVPRGGVRDDLAVDELRGELPHRGLLRAELQVHLGPLVDEQS